VDNLIPKNNHWLSFIFVALAAIIFFAPQQSTAQSSYELLPAPDVWYNSVDGVRVGARLRGQQAGTFGDGPHRLNAGVWLGTNFPEDPVSYYVSFTEPIRSISDFGSEASIQLESLFRTGFQQHGVSFNKRWQTGFDEQNYKELSVGFRAEHRFDDDYLLYTQLWQDEWLYVTHVNFLMTDTHAPGRYWIRASADANLGGTYSQFIRGNISLRQEVKLSDSFTLYGRLYSGFASDQTAPEYLFSRSLKSPRGWMDKGLTRARGTIPPSWIESGVIQIAGGSNLRGYLEQDINALNNGGAALFTSISSLNVELDYPNPIDKAVSNIPVLGGLVGLRSYAFFDAGTSLGLTKFEEQRTLADAGLGFQFSLNIPDYLGKPRGLMIRYDITLWLSHSGNENPFRYRSVVGIGAVISL